MTATASRLRPRTTGSGSAAASTPTPGDEHRLHTEILTGFWQPQPSLQPARTRGPSRPACPFAAGPSSTATSRSRSSSRDDSVEYPFLATELRQRSQEEKSTVFWAATLNDAIDRETVEVYRSKEVLARKERDARTAIETALIAEEKLRLRRHQDELRRLLREALLNGNVYFRGNDRSPAAGADRCRQERGRRPRRGRSRDLRPLRGGRGQAGRRQEGPRRAAGRREPPGPAAGLRQPGARPIRERQGRVRARRRARSHEVLARIEQRAELRRDGERSLPRRRVREGALRLGLRGRPPARAVASFARARSRPPARARRSTPRRAPRRKETFSNNNLFRQASFRPKKGHRLRRAGGGERGLQGHVRDRGRRSSARRRRGRTSARRSTSTRTASQRRSRPSNAIACRVPPSSRRPSARCAPSAAAPTTTRHHDLQRVARLDQGGDPARRGARPGADRAAPRGRQAGAPGPATTPGPSWTASRTSATTSGRRPRAGGHPQAGDLLQGPADHRPARAAIEAAFAERHAAALARAVHGVRGGARSASRQISGWADLDEEQQEQIAAPLVALHRDRRPGARPRSRSCEPTRRVSRPPRHGDRRCAEGDRGRALVSLSLAPYFSGGVETEEQLEQALDGIRDECARLIGAGKKIVVQ